MYQNILCTIFTMFVTVYCSVTNAGNIFLHSESVDEQEWVEVSGYGFDPSFFSYDIMFAWSPDFDPKWDWALGLAMIRWDGSLSGGFYASPPLKISSEGNVQINQIYIRKDQFYDWEKEEWVPPEIISNPAPLLVWALPPPPPPPPQDHGHEWVAGDFDGDGLTDLAHIFDESGLASIDVHWSTGSSFEVARWATRQGGFWDAQKWMAGDFDGDGKDDLANVFNDSGEATIAVHLSTGGSFVGTYPQWAVRQGGFWDAQKWMAGDFDGDGKDDLANVFNDSGEASIDVHWSADSSFGIARWATRQGGF